MTTGRVLVFGESLKISKVIRSQKTGKHLPREGTYIRTTESLGRSLILVNFGKDGEEYIFPEEIT